MMDNMAHRFPRRLVRTAAVLTSLTALAAGTAACSDDVETPLAANTGPEHLRAEVVDMLPFDEDSFTQGLEVDSRGHLLVSTGLQGQSRIYRRELDGDEVQSVDLDPEFFGEGITQSGSNLWQLTWHDGVAIRRDAQTLEETGRFDWPGEGWGICSLDDQTLVASDGSSRVRLLDSRDLTEVGHATVGGDDPVEGLNELECVEGEVYANVFQTDRIVGFDPHTGSLTADIDASGLPNNAEPNVDNVLNGIAHKPASDHFYLAGKRWPDLYEVRFVPQDS